MKLNVPQNVYRRRLERMVEHILSGAPPYLIYLEARLIERAYRPSAWERIKYAFTTSWIYMWLELQWFDGMDFLGLRQSRITAEELACILKGCVSAGFEAKAVAVGFGQLSEAFDRMRLDFSKVYEGYESPEEPIPPETHS